MINSEIPTVIATQISCTLSMVGSFFIILTYILWRDIRTSSRLLLVYLSVADFVTAAGYSVGNIMNVVDPADHRNLTATDPTWCLVESIIANSAQMMSFFWTISIAVYMYVTLVLEKLVVVPKLMKLFHLINWGLPTLIITIAACSKKLGSDMSKTSVGWCWIMVKSDGSNFLDALKWMLVVGKGWEILSYAVIPILYIYIWRNINKKMHDNETALSFVEETKAAMLKINRKFLIIPIVYLFLRVWGTIRFFMFIACHYNKETCEGLTWKHADVFLKMMHGIGDGFQGAANCIIFCVLTATVRDRIVSMFRNICNNSNDEKAARHKKSLKINHDNSMGNSAPSSPTEKTGLLTQTHPMVRSYRIEHNRVNAVLST